MATPEETQPAPEEEAQPPARVAAAQSMIDDAEALLTALAPAGAEPAQKDPFDTSAPMNSVMAVAEALLEQKHASQANEGEKARRMEFVELKIVILKPWAPWLG